MREGQCLRGDEGYTAWYEKPVASGKQQIPPDWQGRNMDTLQCYACLPNTLPPEKIRSVRALIIGDDNP